MLKGLGVKKGDRITIYMPMIPETAVAMLACTRIGAIHSVVFGGFSPDSLAGRIEDCRSNVVITADEGVRGGRKIPLKANTDAAIAKVASAGFAVDHVNAFEYPGEKDLVLAQFRVSRSVAGRTSETHYEQFWRRDPSGAWKIVFEKNAGAALQTVARPAGANKKKKAKRTVAAR